MRTLLIVHRLCESTSILTSTHRCSRHCRHLTGMRHKARTLLAGDEPTPMPCAMSRRHGREDREHRQGRYRIAGRVQPYRRHLRQLFVCCWNLRQLGMRLHMGVDGWRNQHRGRGIDDKQTHQSCLGCVAGTPTPTSISTGREECVPVCDRLGDPMQAS